MYVEVSGISKGQKARLESHPQPPLDSNAMCLTFYYHMYGPAVDTLNVILKQGSVETLIWTRTQTQGNEWKLAQRTIKSVSSWAVSKGFIQPSCLSLLGFVAFQTYCTCHLIVNSISCHVLSNFSLEFCLVYLKTHI